MHLHALRGIDNGGKGFKHVGRGVLALLDHLNADRQHLCEQLQNVIGLQQVGLPQHSLDPDACMLLLVVLQQLCNLTT